MPQLVNMLKLIKSGAECFEADHEPDGLERFAKCGRVIQDARRLGLITYSKETHTLDHQYLTAIEGVALTLAGKTYLRMNG